MTSEIVIARYSEDLAWVNKIPAEFKVIVYNKGSEITSRATLERADVIETLPNSGRESDTFLRHILKKQTYSAGYTVFLQGDPFEHSPDLIGLLNLQTAWQDLQPLSWRWISAKDIPPSDVLERETYQYLSGNRVRSEVYSLATWSPIQFSDPGTDWACAEYRKLHSLPKGTNIAAHFLRRCEWSALAAQAEAHLAGCFSYGGLFATRQQRISALPRHSIELALEAANAHQVYGYVLERLWLHMFGQPFLLPAPSPIRVDEDLSELKSRFEPRQRSERKSLHRQFVPAARRRIVAWAQREQRR